MYTYIYIYIYIYVHFLRQTSVYYGSATHRDLGLKTLNVLAFAHPGTWSSAGHWALPDRSPLLVAVCQSSSLQAEALDVGGLPCRCF